MSNAIQFALNQATAPHLTFEAFLDLAVELGCVGVEPRNDLNRPLFDGLAPAEAAALAASKGLRFVGLSQIYPFNNWTDKRADDIEALARCAKQAGAPGISLIPRVDGVGGADGERQTILFDVLSAIVPILRDVGVNGLVEPIGFSSSSLRFKREAVDAIGKLDASDCIQLVHDTFQHTLAGETDLFPKQTGIVHISGISDPGPAMTEALDAERILVDAHDRLGNLDQIRALLDGGYEGVFSFECTAHEVQNSATLAADMQGSIDYLRRALD